MTSRATACLLAGLVVLVGCSDNGTQGARDAGLDHLGAADAGNTSSIGASGGVFSFHNGRVKLDVPAGALQRDIAVRVLQAKIYPQDPGLVLGTVFELLPAGTVFKKPVKLTIAYSGTKVPNGTPEADLRIHKAVSNSWQQQPGGVDRFRWTAWANLVSFSKYGVKGPKPVPTPDGLKLPDGPRPPDAADMGIPDMGAPDHSSVQCGNGKVDGMEACDGADLGGNTCATVGFTAGKLTCTKQCTLDASKCTKCGNGKIEGQEPCDGAALGGKTCTSAGYGAGQLACSATCSLVTSKCTKCGDKKCEFGEDANICPADCGSSGCGDHVLKPKEQCEGGTPGIPGTLGGHTCTSLGFSGGTLACAADCTLTSDKCASSGCSAADIGNNSYAVKDSDSGISTSLSLVSGSPAMVVDAKGKTHLLFHDDLTYVTDHAGTWTKTALRPGDTVNNFALDLDAAGKVHVAHRDHKGKLHYQTNASGKWVSHTIMTGVGDHVSLVAGSAADVGIAYSIQKKSVTVLSFARRSGTTWKHVDVVKDVSTMGNLVRDTAGKVYVAAGNSGSLQVLMEQATGWMSLTKLSAATASNLVVDSKGALHLLFNKAGLFHATNSKGAWSTTKLSIPATTINPDTLALDAAGKLYFAAAGSKQGDTASCLYRTNISGLLGPCATWPQVIYTNASGVWKASALAFEDGLMNASEMTGCTTYDSSDSTTIHAMAIHGAKLHLAYSRTSTSSTEVSGSSCSPYYFAHVYTYNGHMIKCL